MIAGVPTEFIAPGPQSFDTPPIIDGVDWFTKPVLVSALSVVVIVWFFWGASRKAAIVPSKLQFAGELGYNFVRNSIARDAIGSQEYMKYVPYLCGLFFFILLNNVAATDPAGPVPDLQPHRLGVRGRDHELGHLQRGRHPQARPLGLLQAPDDAGRCAAAG